MTARRALVLMGLLFAAPFFYVLLFGRISAALLPLRFALLVLMPLATSLCLFAAFRWRSTAQANLVLSFVSVGVALVLVELLLPVIQHTAALARIEIDDDQVDRRDKLQVVLDLQADGIEAVPSIEPKGLLVSTSSSERRSRLSDEGAELQPVGGIASRPTVVCNETGNWVMYDSDRFGMNNPDAAWDLPSLDVAVVGDSFTNGWCSGSDEHYVGLLRGRYPQLVNLGQSGNGPLLILASILEYLPDRRPTNVVWFHYEGNDFWDLDAELESELLRSYLESGRTQDLAHRQATIDREILQYVDNAIGEWRGLGDLVVGDFNAAFNLASLKRVLKLTYFRAFFGLQFVPEYSPNYTKFEEIMAASRSAVDAWEGRIWFVYLPASTRYRAVVGSAAPWEAQRTRVIEHVLGRGIPVIDIHEAFVAHGRPLSLYNSIRDSGYGHFTSEGNRIVAAAVLDALAGKNGR